MARAGTSSLDVCDRLRALIRSGELLPGTPLREQELARRFGVSRTPVREAFRRLEADGLLQHEAHKGMVVPRLDPQAVTELYVMREVLEGTAAALAAQHATEAEIAFLADMVAADRVIADRPDALAATNRRFHEAIHHAAHNRYLLKSLRAIRVAIDMLGPTTLAVPGRGAEAVDQHAAVLDAIAGRDPAAAETLARGHVRSSHKARLALLFD
ncbi:MAG: GntR family transcriptional regulator [Hyphomicrobiales bacterium]|nr:GntR family transcriptional regulator [Hyphomicrobiales bacterium]